MVKYNRVFIYLMLSKKDKRGIRCSTGLLFPDKNKHHAYGDFHLMCILNNL